MAEQQIWVLCPVCNNKTRTKNTQRHGTGKFPSLLSKMQKRKFSDNKKRNYNHYQRARRLDAEPIIYKLYSL